MPVMVFGSDDAVSIISGMVETDLVQTESLAVGDLQRTKFVSQDSFSVADDKESAGAKILESLGTPDALSHAEGTVAESLSVPDLHRPTFGSMDTFAVADAGGPTTHVRGIDSVGVADGVSEALVEGTLREGTQVADLLHPKPRGIDSVSVDDGILLPKARGIDSVGMNEIIRPKIAIKETLNTAARRLRAKFDDIAAGSGASSNIFGDAYVDRASPDTNFGSGTELFVQSNNPVTPDEQRAYFKFAYTAPLYTGFESPAQLRPTFRFRFYASGGVGSRDLEWSMKGFTSDPFNETTITWNTGRPDMSSPSDTGRILAVPNAPGSVVSVFGEFGDYRDKWIVIEFYTIDDIIIDFRIHARENATDPPLVSNEWLLFNY